MTIVYFVIAAVALAGAVGLLWLDRQRSADERNQRAEWGEQHDFKYRESDGKLRKVFGRATMDVPDHLTVRDVAYGNYGGAEAVVFDLAETATIVAVRRSSASKVFIDLRHEDVLAPAEDDVELLGAMGARVMFSNDLDVARRVCDRRMVTLANNAPAYVEVLWNEGNWALGSMPLTADPDELDTGLEVVRRFADLLRVLPPLRDPQDAPDPRDPHGPIRAELADEKTENMRDENRREALLREQEDGPRPAAPTPRPGAAGSGRFPQPGQSGRNPAPGFARPEDRNPARPDGRPLPPQPEPRTASGRVAAPIPIRRNVARETDVEPAGGEPLDTNFEDHSEQPRDRAPRPNRHRRRD